MNLNPNPNPNPNPPSDHSHSSDYAPYPKLDPNDVAPVSETWTPVTVKSNPPYQQPRSPEGPARIYGSAATTMPTESNPYVTPEPAQPPGSLVKSKALHSSY